MPRLSLYRPNKQNDYRFMDRTISEMLTVGGTDLLIHKYLGPANTGPSTDATQPQYDVLSPTNIQDLLFLENRDRIYDTSVYRLRGHYNVQNLDFDLSQFGLFLNNDIIFIVVHYNDMIDIVGRKLMVGDVIELPHLLDYNPLDESIQFALKRFYQITDANFASEGFTQTWYPHLWRIKCEKLTASQEFSQILQEPNNQDNYLGLYDKDKVYPPGYVITFGDKNYISKIEVPAGITPPNETYWELAAESTLKDILTPCMKNIEINDAALEEAKRLVPLSGYDTLPLYIVPTYGLYEKNGVPSSQFNNPAPPVNVDIDGCGRPGTYVTGYLGITKNPNYKTQSSYIKIPKQQVQSIWDMTADGGSGKIIQKFAQTSLELIQHAPKLYGNGSGPVSGTVSLAVTCGGPVTGPYGTTDNTYATADANPVAPGFTGDITQQMDWRADADPRFQYIARYSPRSFGYTAGYLTGNGNAPNGFPVGSGISFPQNPKVGDYFLRIDYQPQVLFRWDGVMWIRISSNIRTGTGWDLENRSLLSTFINNPNELKLTDGTLIPEKQPLSTVLSLKPDALPPVP